MTQSLHPAIAKASRRIAREYSLPEYAEDIAQEAAILIYCERGTLDPEPVIPPGCTEPEGGVAAFRGRIVKHAVTRAANVIQHLTHSRTEAKYSRGGADRKERWASTGGSSAKSAGLWPAELSAELALALAGVGGWPPKRRNALRVETGDLPARTGVAHRVNLWRARAALPRLSA